MHAGLARMPSLIDDALERADAINRARRNQLLDMINHCRWDHVWLYERFAQLRMLKQLQVQARALADADV